MWHFWAKPAVLSVNCYFLPLTRFIFKFFHCKYIFTAQKKEVKDVFHFSRKNKLDWKTNCNGKSWTQQTRHILFRLTINSTVRYSHWSSNFFIFNSCIIFCMFPSLRLLFYKKISAIWLAERSTILAVFLLCFQYWYSLTE